MTLKKLARKQRLKSLNAKETFKSIDDQAHFLRVESSALGSFVGPKSALQNEDLRPVTNLYRGADVPFSPKDCLPTGPLTQTRYQKYRH